MGENNAVKYPHFSGTISRPAKGGSTHVICRFERDGCGKFHVQVTPYGCEVTGVRSGHYPNPDTDRESRRQLGALLGLKNADPNPWLEKLEQGWLGSRHYCEGVRDGRPVRAPEEVEIPRRMVWKMGRDGALAGGGDWRDAKTRREGRWARAFVSKYGAADKLFAVRVAYGEADSLAVWAALNNAFSATAGRAGDVGPRYRLVPCGHEGGWALLDTTSLARPLECVIDAKPLQGGSFKAHSRELIRAFADEGGSMHLRQGLMMLRKSGMPTTRLFGKACMIVVLGDIFNLASKNDIGFLTRSGGSRPGGQPVLPEMEVNAGVASSYVWGLTPPAKAGTVPSRVRDRVLEIARSPGQLDKLLGILSGRGQRGEAVLSAAIGVNLSAGEKRMVLLKTLRTLEREFERVAETLASEPRPSSRVGKADSPALEL